MEKGVMDSFAVLKCNVVLTHISNIIWCNSYEQGSDSNSKVLHKEVTTCAILCSCLVFSN